MPAIETIKDYLVRLGFDVDNNEFNKFKSALNDISSLVAKNASEITTQYVNAGAAVVGTITTMVGAIVGLANKVADSDMAFQLFAQRMYMSNEMAKAFKITTDALGHSLNEIAWNPELRSHYFELMKEVREMQVPGNARETYEQLRSTGFEFTRLKVEAVSAIDWIVFHLVKMNNGSLADFKGSLSFINNKIQHNMPQWTHNVAKFLNPFIVLGRDIALIIGGIFRAGSKLFDLLSSFWDKMESWQKNAIAFNGFLIALFSSLMIGGKFGAFLKGLTLITTALLLLDDAIAHFEGRPSHGMLAGLWDFAESINIYFTKVILNAMIAWKHFQAAIHGKESWGQAWTNLMKDKAASNAEIDKVLADIRAEREKSKREIILQQQQAAGYLQPQVYEVPQPFSGKLEGNALSRIDSYTEQIRKAAQKYGLSEELIKSVIYTESRGRHDVVSPKGAIGLMQVMPGTAALYGVSSANLYDWRKNIDLGARILSDEIKAGGSITEGLKRYNAGGNWRAKAGAKLQSQTSDYANKVLGAYDYYNQRKNAASIPSSATSKGNVAIKQGDVNVNVNVSSGASPDEIAKMTARRIREETDRNNLILSREFSGVY